MPTTVFSSFDADNIWMRILSPEMNNVFDNGYKVVMSYRNSKTLATTGSARATPFSSCAKQRSLTAPM